MLESHKTESGYLKISNPILTATDLIQFERRVGGLNRVATILNELAEVLVPESLNTDILNHIPVTTLQRLGFIIENVCANVKLADAVFELLQNQKSVLFRIPLKSATTSEGFSSNNRWNVIVNTEIEIDD